MKSTAQHRPQTPEPFRTALMESDLPSVEDAPADGALERFARGRVRAGLGHDDPARADFEAARAELGRCCDLELALLDIRAHEIRSAEETARQVLGEAASQSYLEARALHILGLALNKRREPEKATDALLRARQAYVTLGERDLAAQASDTLGLVLASTGQLGLALTYYSLSIAYKNLVGDTYGMALSFGNMGRVHFRAGRHEEAIECFRADLELAPGDLRGRARILNDLARVEIECERPDEAVRLLEESQSIAEEQGYRDVRFFVQLDLGRARVLQADLRRAEEHLQTAEDRLSEGAEAYLRALLSRAWADFALARGTEEDRRLAIQLLESAIKDFVEARLPDQEIPARLLLAQTFVERGRHSLAFECLRPALELARGDGLSRFLPPIREALARLDLAEDIAEERGRSLVTRPDRVENSHFVILGQLGEGGFGKVFRALDPQRNRIVALKLLRMASSKRVDRETALASLKREYEAVAQIKAPGIARVYAVGFDIEERPYVAQEYIDGLSLRALFGQSSRDDPDPVEFVAGTVARIAVALETLHEKGIVHRDLKPENILLRRGSYVPVLIDFGIAQVGERDAGIAGTLSYMAPEQTHSEIVDPAADLYALGVIMFEWLTGEHPLGFDRERNLTAKQVREDKPRLVGDVRGDLSEGFAALVNGLLAKAPSSRPTIQEVQQTCLETIE